MCSCDLLLTHCRIPGCPFTNPNFAAITANLCYWVGLVFGVFFALGFFSWLLEDLFCLCGFVVCLVGLFCLFCFCSGWGFLLLLFWETFCSVFLGVLFWYRLSLCIAGCILPVGSYSVLGCTSGSAHSPEKGLEHIWLCLGPHLGPGAHLAVPKSLPSHIWL